ncbi:MAG TPA: 4-hydroxy-tetrahydrodipicolinate reductase, partial [Methanobacterium sp.]
MINVAVTGASGRMGSKIIKNILEEEDLELVAAIEAPETPFAGKDVGEVIGAGTIGVEITPADELKEVLEETKPDVLVDFTIAGAAVETIKTSSECGVNLVVGTTGFSDEQLNGINKVIEENKVNAVIAPNMAVGVNVFFKILKDLAPILADY